MESSTVTNTLVQVPTDVLTSPGSRLESRIRVAQSATGDRQKSELKKVSQEFEAIFMAQLLKVMRETIEESGVTEGGLGKSIYTELFDQEVSLSMARRGALGISDLLYRNLAERNAAAASPQSVEPKTNSQAPSQAQPVDTHVSEEAGNDISDLQLPIHAPVSSAFGMRRDPFTHAVRFHKGLDLSAPEGTKVVAALPGKVISAGYQSGYGNTVLMQHADGLRTRYAHLEAVTVKAGDVIDSEAVLGKVGQTGRSTGPHLHFEVIRMGEPVNPLAAAGQSFKHNSVHSITGRIKA